MGELLMSRKERRRLELMYQVKGKIMTLKKASELLGLSYRQSKRIWRRYRIFGDAGLVHRLRGRPSMRSRSKEFQARVLELYRDKYRDFGPTLASEHLAKEGYEVAHETLRRWLIGAGMWERRRKRGKHRQWRERKEYMGELVQMDGSSHDWFEGRGPKAVLMVMIDDATNRTYARFVKAETTEGAMECFEGYARLYGLPQALYVDLDSIYRIAKGEPTLEEQLQGRTRPCTQFERAMNSLGVRLIPAYSPQAKGRVERRNGVFQDRLIKEMRLAGIVSIEQANKFLEEKFLPDLNRRFTVAAAKSEDLHRPVGKETDLTEILSIEETRQVGRDWTITWHRRHFQLLASREPLPLAGKAVTVRQMRTGELQMLYQGRKLRWKELPPMPGSCRPSALRSPATSIRAHSRGAQSRATAI